MQQALGQPADFSSLQAIPGQGDFAGERRRIEDEALARFDEQMAPEFARQMSELEQNLANRGIPVGSELFNKQLGQLQESQSRARIQAAENATNFAAQEQGRLFNQGMEARRQGVSDLLTQRGLPLQELGSVLNLQSGIFGMQPRFGQGIQPLGIQGVDPAAISQGLGALNLQRQQFGLEQARAGAGGGVDPNADPFAREKFLNQLKQQNIAFEQPFLLERLAAGGSGQSSIPSIGTQFGSALAGAVGQGLGSGLAGLF